MMRKNWTSRIKDQEVKQSLVAQEELKLDRRGPPPMLKDISVRPHLSRKKTTGTLAAHLNGFRFVTTDKIKVDVRTQPHTHEQPCALYLTSILISCSPFVCAFVRSSTTTSNPRSISLPRRAATTSRSTSNSKIRSSSTRRRSQRRRASEDKHTNASIASPIICSLLFSLIVVPLRSTCNSSWRSSRALRICRCRLVSATRMVWLRSRRSADERRSGTRDSCSSSRKSRTNSLSQ